MDYTLTEQMQNLNDPSNSLIPKVYAVALGSDIFHESVSVESLKRIFAEMNKARHHSFEILTKRIERAYCLSKEFEWTSNIFMGVSVESGEYNWRVNYLRKIPAQFRFLSVSPILGPFGEIDLSGIDMIGVVEETWGLKRKAKQEWIMGIEKQCQDQGVELRFNDSYLWRTN